MFQQLQSRWPPTRKQALWAGAVVALAAVLAFFAIVICGYLFGWKWTGLPKRTLWDWLDVLIVPAVLAIGGYWFAEHRAQSDRHIEAQRAQETALQAFIDQISQSGTYSELRTAPASGDKRAVLRAQLQTLLMQLNEERKGVLLSFLHGAKLCRKKEITPHEHTKEESEKTGEERWRYPILRLNDIDFSRTKRTPDTKLTFDDLESIILRRAKLSEVNLSGANLKNADLRDADLRGTVLRKATSQDSEEIPGEFHNEVAKAIHNQAESPPGLLETDLSGANLRGADLRGADLSGAVGITNEELEQQAKSLKGATMPDGQKYEDWLKSKGRVEDGESPGPS